MSVCGRNLNQQQRNSNLSNILQVLYTFTNTNSASLFANEVLLALQEAFPSTYDSTTVEQVASWLDQGSRQGLWTKVCNALQSTTQFSYQFNPNAIGHNYANRIYSDIFTSMVPANSKFPIQAAPRQVVCTTAKGSPVGANHMCCSDSFDVSPFTDRS